MKKLNVTFRGTEDATRYLFSFAKCLSAALRSGGYEEYADDIIASSGFAFRMWVDKTLCPSATSIWSFHQQKPWVENGGLLCEYTERLWGQNAVEEKKRLEGLDIIKKSIDNGMAAVVWDLSGAEWGLAIGYDDETSKLCTLKINEKEDSVPYEKLGKLDIPILSVLAVVGKAPKETSVLIADTKKLAVSHLLGKEWCDNAKGLDAYDVLSDFVLQKLSADTFWNLEYYLGTYCALKQYAWRFFQKYGEYELAALYHAVYDAWKEAFDLKRAAKSVDVLPKEKIAALLLFAKAKECEAVAMMRE